MSLTPIFTGRIKRGLTLLDKPRDYGAWAKSLEGERIELILRKRRSQRSTQANRYYFGVVIRIMAEHCGYHPDEMHEALAYKFLRLEDDPITGSPRRKRTPACDTAEFAEYVDRCKHFAAEELGLVIPDPGEVEL